MWKTVKSSSKKESLALSKQKEIFEELANEITDEILNLSKQIDFNNLIYHFKRKSSLTSFIGFKGPLGFYENTNHSYTAPEKKKENQRKIKTDKRNSKSREKSEEQKSAMKTIKALYQSREEVTKLFNDYSKIVAEAKYKTKYGKSRSIIWKKQVIHLKTC